MGTKDFQQTGFIYGGCGSKNLSLANTAIALARADTPLREQDKYTSYITVGTRGAYEMGYEWGWVLK